MKALTAAEMREVDRLTIERQQISGTQLMEAAGKHVADTILRVCSPQASLRILVLCGKGNNGGDGLVCARHLKEAGRNPRVWYFGPLPKPGTDAGNNFILWQRQGGALALIEDEAAWQKKMQDVGRAQIVIDALLGTGLRGAAEGLIGCAI